MFNVRGARSGDLCRRSLDNLNDLLELARIDFAPLYERVAGASDFEPGDILPSDTVLTRGSGRYHAAKRDGAGA